MAHWSLAKVLAEPTDLSTAHWAMLVLYAHTIDSVQPLNHLSALSFTYAFFMPKCMIVYVLGNDTPHYRIRMFE
jgi:hypothetical protein